MARTPFDFRRLYRYDQETTTYAIDVLLDTYRELYNEWDFSPLQNRDLDEDLLDYLLSCSSEIPAKHPLSICLNLPEGIRDPIKESRCTKGFHNFFNYLLRKEALRTGKILRQMASFFAVGSLLIIIAYVLRSLSIPNAWMQILYEGITIGGWVAFWEFFSIFFFSLNQHSSLKKRYERLLKAKIVFGYR